jgi:hypothetical protein
MRDITDVMGNLETDSRGVTVQASTLGEEGGREGGREGGKEEKKDVS